MPVVGAGGGSGSGQPPPRTTFRPPWVKDGPQPIPMPSAPWKGSKPTAAQPENKQEASSLVTRALRKVSDPNNTPEDKNNNNNSTSGSNNTTPTTGPRKTSKITIVPSQPKENGLRKTPEPVRKISEPVPEPNKKTETARKVSEPVGKAKEPKTTVVSIEREEPSRKRPETTVKREEPVRKREETKRPEVTSQPDAVKKPMEKQLSRQKAVERTKTSETLAMNQPPPPPMPPAAPPMAPLPPPPPPTAEFLKDKKPISSEQREKIEALRSRPKRRPDWGNMMKEIETGRKLNHVSCNDRSAPLLPRVKAKGQFVYESERPNLHNQLLKQIETGVKLKCVKTNDRSKPFIEGLRKFRRQMTIEEQIQKSTSMATMGILEVEPDPLDEVDDIDKVRDDLQSTKQMLAMELKNKEALERENKKLLAKLLNLEVELEKERNRTSKSTPEDQDEMRKDMKKLKDETEKAKKLADEMESKYHDVASKLDLAKVDLEDALQKSIRLEKQLKTAQAANLAHSTGQSLAKQPSAKKLAQINRTNENSNVKGRQPTPDPESESEEEEEDETESESETDEEDKQAQKERRLARELKLLTTKLKSFKDKREVAKKERKALKEQMSKQQRELKAEKKKYKELQKEVDKMSNLMNEADDEEDEEEDDVEDEEEETETESESESDESEESEGDLPESSPIDDRKNNLQKRVKRYENLLGSLKKGNYLLKANVDRYKDELSKQKEMSLTLQEDLNSVLAELG